MAMFLSLAMSFTVPRLQQTVQLAGVLAQNLALNGRADRSQVLADPLLRVGPDAVGVRIVRTPHDVVLADERDHHRHRGLVLIGRVPLAPPELAGLHRQIELVVAVLVLLVHAIQDIGKPRHAGLAEHELELRKAIEGARENDAREELGRDDLEHGGAGGAVSQVVFLLHRLVRGLARRIARRVERDRHAALLGRLPERIPGAVPDGVGCGRHGEVGALEAQTRGAPELARCRGRLVAGDAREPDEAPGIALAEVGGPVVVDLVHGLDQLTILHAQPDPEDAVHHLGIDAVDLLVLQSQGRRRRMRPALVEAGLEHPFHVLGEVALHLVEAEPEPAEDPELLFLGEPARAVRCLAHLRNLIAQPRRRVLHPEIAGHPGHVDVAVGGDDAVAHRWTSLAWDVRATGRRGAGALPTEARLWIEGAAGACTAEDIAPPRPAVKTAPGTRQSSCTLLSVNHPQRREIDMLIYFAAV